MTLDSPPAHTELTNRPQLSTHPSYSSTTESDNYSSEYATDRSDPKTDETQENYETPPSRLSTPHYRNRAVESEMTLPVLQTSVAPANMNQQRHNARIEPQKPRATSDPVTPDADDTPYIHFALEQLNYDETLNGSRHDSLTEGPYPDHSVLPQVDISYKAPPPPVQQQYIPVTLIDTPQTPISKIGYIPDIGKRESPEIALLVDPPAGQRWLELGFVPAPLRFTWLALFFVANLLMMAGLIFSCVFGITHHGLFDYDGNRSPRYFVFEYLPQILGMVIIFWRFVIQAAIFRAAPFFRISEQSHSSEILQTYRTTPSNFLLPDTSFFRSGQPIIGTALLILWLSNFTIPLLSCLYQTQYYTDDGPARFRWTTSQGVGWTLFALFLLLAVVPILCLIHFRRSKSGLMWDPVSIADIISLFNNSNILSDFERTEVASNLTDIVVPKPIRLGFWTTSLHPNIFHGIGEENAPVRTFSPRISPRQEKRLSSRYSEDVDTEAQRSSYASSFIRSIHSPFVRYRWTPWYLRDSAVLAWAIIAVLLLIAFLVVSYVNKAVSVGFNPRLPSITRSGGFSSSNFLFSFLPSLLGMILFLLWQPIDTYFRTVQPFVNLSSPTGADARESLLLAYPSYLPGEVTIRALLNRDFKVAYVSLVTLVAATIPVLAGGVFTALFYRASDQVRMVASMPGYIGLSIFVSIYALSYLIIWPTRKRYLPHKVSTVSEIVSFLYASPLLAERSLRNLRAKSDLETRLIGIPAGSRPSAMTGDTREKPRARQHYGTSRYAFGIYVGLDGREHLGIDRLQRPGSGEMLVTQGMTR